MNRNNKQDILKNKIIDFAARTDRNDIYFKMPLLFAVIFILTAVFIFAYKISASSNENTYLTVAIIEIITIALPMIIYQRLFNSTPVSHSMRFFAPDKLILVFLCALAMIFGAISITTLFSQLGFIKTSYSTYANFDIPNMPNELSTILFASLTFALIPAVCEELLCRGLLFSEYEKYGSITAVIVSTILFAMMHFSFGQLPVYLFCGLLLGFLRALTNSVFAPLIAHFIYNMFALFYQQFFGALTEQFNEFRIVFFIATLLCFLILYFMFGEADRIYNSYARKNTYIESNYKALPLLDIKNTVMQFLTSPSFILCIILYIVFTLVF